MCALANRYCSVLLDVYNLWLWSEPRQPLLLCCAQGRTEVLGCCTQPPGPSLPACVSVLLHSLSALLGFPDPGCVGGGLVNAPERKGASLLFSVTCEWRGEEQNRVYEEDPVLCCCGQVDTNVAS